MSFYLFIAISFYRNIAILCVKILCVNRALMKGSYESEKTEYFLKHRQIKKHFEK